MSETQNKSRFEASPALDLTLHLPGLLVCGCTVSQNEQSHQF